MRRLHEVVAKMPANLGSDPRHRESDPDQGRYEAMLVSLKASFVDHTLQHGDKDAEHQCHKNPRLSR